MYIYIGAYNPYMYIYLNQIALVQLLKWLKRMNCLFAGALFEAYNMSMVIIPDVTLTDYILFDVDSIIITTHNYCIAYVGLMPYAVMCHIKLIIIVLSQMRMYATHSHLNVYLLQIYCVPCKYGPL